MRQLVLISLVLYNCLSGYTQIVSSIDLSDPIIENNMTFVVEADPAAEAYSIATTIAGVECRHIPLDKYGYFTTTNGSVSSLDNNLIVTITYYDNDISELSFQYNSTSDDYSYINIPKSGSNKWLTVKVSLTDASFRKAQNNGADFRVDGGNYLSTISIQKGQLDP